MKNLFQLGLVFSSLVGAVQLQATSPITPAVNNNSYTGTMDCASAKAFVVARAFFLSNYDCEVTVSTTEERVDAFGDRFGAFTFQVKSLGRAPASYTFDEAGTYWTSRRTGRIAFNFDGQGYPQPGRNYSYGVFGRLGLTLATSFRGGSFLRRQ